MSETRQRVRQVGVRLLPDEWDALTAEAQRQGVSPADVLRTAFLQARAGEGALRERIEAVLADGDHDAFCDQDEECECWRRRIRAALDTAGDPT